jgi:uridylate kinase
MPKYKRILLKLSGESLAGEAGHGIDPVRLKQYAEQIKEIADMEVEIGIVIGGGNIFRGLSAKEDGFERVKGDYMGMLATVINGLAIQSGLETIGARAIMFTAIEMEPVGIRFSKPQVLEALGSGSIAIFTFGTGNPYFTTDTAASLRAVEMEADVLLKGTRVDGVYTADPEKDPSATRYEEISFEEVIRKDLKIMDQTAFTMCRENQLPIIVFNMNEIGNLKRIIQGERLGTLVKI